MIPQPFWLCQLPFTTQEYTACVQSNAGNDRPRVEQHLLMTVYLAGWGLDGKSRARGGLDISLELQQLIDSQLADRNNRFSKSLSKNLKHLLVRVLDCWLDKRNL